jgi:hypothetical protein
MRIITKNQLDYIKVLSSYDSTKDFDNNLINNYCSSKKKTLKTLNTEEACELIDDLLQVQVVYMFKCGIKKLLSKHEVNRGRVLGDIELCLHSCPISTNVCDCEYWKKSTI